MSNCGHKKIILKLQEEIRHLKQKLTYYENPHSPPSSNSLEWKKQKLEAKKKRDADSNKSRRGGIP